MELIEILKAYETLKSYGLTVPVSELGFQNSERVTEKHDGCSIQKNRDGVSFEKNSDGPPLQVKVYRSRIKVRKFGLN